MIRRQQQNKALDSALDELIRQEKDPSTILSEGGLLKQLTKRLVERALNAEMDEHLGYSRYDRSDSDNNRNGNSGKQLVTNNGVVDLSLQ